MEQDLEETIQNTILTVQRLLTRNKDLIPEIQCLSITNQRETITIFIKDTGIPLYNAMVWQCRRDDSICADLNANGVGEIVHKKTGLKLDICFSASKQKWLIDGYAEIRRPHGSKGRLSV